MLEDTEWTGLESNIWKLYLFKMLYGFFISIPIIVLFWKSNGLDMFQVMLLQGLFAVSVIFLEVPTGYFADRYGRKLTLLYAAVFATIGITAYSLGTNFYQFLLGELLWAIGVSLVSGADSAMFFDTLVEMGEEESYKELWGKANSYYMFSAAGAAILGGIVAEASLRLTLFMQIPFFAAMIPLAWSMREPEHHREVSEEEKELKEVVKEVFKRPKLRNLMIYAAVLYAGLQTAFWFYQPYFKLTVLDIAAFGFIYAGFNVVSALSSKYAHSIEDQVGKRISLIGLVVLVSASLFLMSRFVFVLSIGFILLQQFVRGFSKPVISDYINRIVESENRSTILSTRSLLGRVIMAVSMPLFGLISDLYDIQHALLLLAATVLATGTTTLLLLWTEDVIEL
ncbi:MAG: MFS transporter [Candidatus Nanosalina sp.]